MRKLLSKTLKLSFAFAILSASLFSCSEDVLNPEDSAARPPADKIQVPQH